MFFTTHYMEFSVLYKLAFAARVYFFDYFAFKDREYIPQ